MALIILIISVVVGLLVLGGLVWWDTRLSREVERDWKNFAKNQGLEFDETSPGLATLRGSYAGWPVRIHTGPDGERGRWTVFEAALPGSVPPDLYVG